MPVVGYATDMRRYAVLSSSETSLVQPSSTAQHACLAYTVRGG